MDNQKNRHTNIISDFNAIALAQQQGGKRKGQPKKKKKKSAPGPRTAPQPVAGSLKPKPKPKSKPAQKAAPNSSTSGRFYEKNGLKISLYEKSGRRRQYARHSEGLRSKNQGQLLDIVEEYGGADKKKAFIDANATKADIADWIETVETLAMPPNPRNKLSLPGPAPEEDFEVDANDPLWDNEPVMEGKGKGKAVAQNQGMSGGFAIHMSQSTNESTGKRKHDNAPEPTHAAQQTVKKAKLHHENEQPTKQSHVERKRKDHQPKRDAPRKVRIEEPEKDAEPEPLIPTMSAKDDGKTDEQTHTTANLINFMADFDMHPDNVDTSSMIVHLPEDGEDMVITASTLRNGKTVMHSTPIPLNRNKARVVIGQNQSTQHRLPSAEPSFLKPGLHGRGGDFTDDPDRRTGRGHQITLQDRQGLENYYMFRGPVLRKYLRYPVVGEDEEEVDEEVRRGWEENEEWFRRYGEKYRGHAMCHLWACGCERARGKSEDGESEEE
jgi:hypothetical protein